MLRRSAALSLSLLLLAACSEEVTGPTPEVSPDDTGELAATQPSFACNEQLESWITLRGTDFSPLVIDSLDKDVETSVELPVLTLRQSAAVSGDAVSGEAVEATIQNLDAPPSEDVPAQQVKWLDDTNMQFLVYPALELAPGVYDVHVENANGETDVKQAAFGVLPRPNVSALEPAYMCLAQGERVLDVVGDNFLIQGESLPTVTVGGEEFAPMEASDCRDVAPVFGEHQLCETLTISIPQAQFEPSVQDVSVTNIEPAACQSDAEADGSELTVIPPPAVTGIQPELACVSEGERSFTVSGQDFVQTSDGATPTVLIAGNEYETTAMNCEEVSVYNGTFQRCTDVSFAVPQDDLEPGAHSVVVRNPDPAGCESSEPLDLTISPPPSISDVAPEVLCSQQIENTLTITGENFVRFDGTTPTVTIDGNTFDSTASNCTAIDTVVNSTAEYCTTLEITIPADTVMEGEQTVVVTNPDPAGCMSTDMVTVNFVPPPEITAVVEDFTCVANQTVTVEIQGSGFLDVDGTTATVTIGGETVTVTDISGCTQVGSTNTQTCDTLTVEVTEDQLMEGMHDVEVSNPAPAACVSEEDIQLEVVGPPAVTDVQPAFFCNDTGTTSVTVTGTDFYVVDGNNPSIEIDGQTFTATATAGTCTATSRTDVETCTELTADIGQGAVSAGTHEVIVTNPDPVACFSETNGSVLVGGPPTITSTSPMAVCAGDTFNGVVTLNGDNFLTVDGTLPSVTIEGTSVTPDSVANCTAVSGTTQTIQSCTELTLTVPVALRSGGDIDISVENPSPADCGQPATTTLQFAPTPDIATVTPLRVCEDGGTVQIDGTDLDPGLSVTLNGATVTDSDTTSDSDGIEVVDNGDGTQTATVTFPAGLTTGLHDLTVTNPNSCSDTFDTQVRVVPGPTPFFVDPPTVYNGISTQVTIYLTGLFGGSVQDITLEDSMGNQTSVSYTFDPNNPNTVQAVIPASILASGVTEDTFDVIITDDVNCGGTAQDLVTVTDELTVAVEGIDPPFGWTDDSTAVTITSPDTLPAGQTNFVATPRAYLNPANPQPGDIATELEALQFLDATELNAIVPDQLPVDTYDLIVVNPDGTVGLLQDAFDVTADEPPTIDSVSPGSWETGEAAFPFIIEGENFRSPTAEATCQLSGGGTATATITVTGDTATTINATVDTGPLDHLSVCEIRVTNTGDGTYADFAPITITNPAGNFVQFSHGTDLNTARRKPAMADGRPSRVARYIYAIGGDDGTTAGAMQSVEAAQTNRFGVPGTWFDLVPANPTARSNGDPVLPAGAALSEAARIDDFIYLVGGHDGTNPSAAVWRAHVLDPLDNPDVTNVEFDVDPNMMGGLTPGVYYYRVSAVLSSTNAANPDGETLPSTAQPVRIPFQGIDLTLAWSSHPDAVEYRIYRSTNPDEPLGNEELLATVPASQTSLVDDGTTSTTADDVPLQTGSLGAWHQVSTLQTARHSHGVTVATDPNDSSIHHIYAAGGDDGTNLLDSVEYVTVTVNGPGDQTVSANGATPVDPNNGNATVSLSEARSELAVVNGNPQNASNLSATYIYVLGGASTGGSGITRTNEVAEVLAGGDLTTFVAVTNMQRDRAGYVSAVANNNIVAACGQGGSPSSSADKLPISSTSPPDLGSSSALGDTGDLRSRYLSGYVSASGFLYTAGGIDGSNAVSNTLDYSVLGGTP